MALSMTLCGMTEQVGREAQGEGFKSETFDAFLGIVDVLKDDPRFRSIPLNGGYADYAAVLSPDEVVELAASTNPTAEALKKLRTQVKKYLFVLVYIYEWESGL